MSDEVTRQAAELRAERDNWQNQSQQHYDNLQRMIGKCDALVAERDAALADVRLQLAAKSVIIQERDVAERERTESRAEVVRLRAECEGLRADLLAHPPELHQELAIERKRHLELQEDYDRQEVRIAMLEDAVKRAEKVQCKPELQGYLAAIVQLAHTAGGMV